jgi:hypothetical protein
VGLALAFVTFAASLSGCFYEQDFGTSASSPGDAAASETGATVDAGSDAGADGSAPSLGSDSGGAPKLVPCPTGPLCTVDPLPTADEYRSMWASADDDLWLVTQSGTVVHGDGTTFRAVYQAQGPVRSALVTGTAADDVWVVLNERTASSVMGRAIHWDGSAWGNEQPLGEAEILSIARVDTPVGPGFLALGAND